MLRTSSEAHLRNESVKSLVKEGGIAISHFLALCDLMDSDSDDSAVSGIFHLFLFL